MICYFYSQIFYRKHAFTNSVKNFNSLDFKIFTGIVVNVENSIARIRIYSPLFVENLHDYRLLFGLFNTGLIFRNFKLFTTVIIKRMIFKKFHDMLSHITRAVINKLSQYTNILMPRRHRIREIKSLNMLRNTMTILLDKCI